MKLENLLDLLLLAVVLFALIASLDSLAKPRPKIQTTPSVHADCAHRQKMHNLWTYTRASGCFMQYKGRYINITGLRSA